MTYMLINNSARVDVRYTTHSTTANKIKSFLKYSVGWHYGQGGPATYRTVKIALQYLEQFSTFGFPESDAFFGEDGQILVSAYKDDFCLEVTVETDSTFTVSAEKSGLNHYYEPGLSGLAASMELDRLTKKAAEEACVTSDLSNLNISIKEQESLKTLLLRPLAAEHRFSVNTVGSQYVRRAVPTQIPTTRVSGVNLQHTTYLKSQPLTRSAEFNAASPIGVTSVTPSSRPPQKLL